MKNTHLSAVFALFFAVTTLTVAGSAVAQSKGEAQPAAGGSGAISKQAIEAVPPPDDPSSPFEANGKSYHFVGARFRYIIIPKFMMGLFASGGTSLGVPAFGPEFSIRKNGFENTFALTYAAYSMDPVQFKGKNDAEAAWEIVDAHIKVLYLTSDFMWSAPLSPDKVSFVYGAGAGLGLVFGDIHRVQAYLASGPTGESGTYAACRGPGNPPGMYCGGDNNHYGDYTEPSWANGGSKPIIFPWLSLNTGLRIKPSRSVVMRLDVGWNLFNGPFFGLAVNYGLPRSN